MPVDLFSYFLEVIRSLISWAAWFTSATTVFWRILKPSALSVGISGMALYCQLRTYHFLGTIILDGIGISRDSTSAIQKIVCSHRATILRSPADHGTHGVKKGARRLPGGGARGGYADPRHRGERGQGSRRRECGELGSSDHGDPFDSPDLDMPSFSLGLTPPAQLHPRGLGTSYAFLPPSLGFFFISVTCPSEFRVFFISGTSFSGTVSSFRHVFLRARLVHLHCTSSSDSHDNDDEQTDDIGTAAWIWSLCWEEDY
ncbi:hypothetical protein M9H77_00521 [Catharanthus roseus]|nr:hypothetical protein M9H77_00521 [Catharanthus roseus]